MVSFTQLALLVTSVSALAVRDVQVILRDLRFIDSNTTALTDAANRYTGGTFGALPIRRAAADLEDAIDLAATNAQAQPPVTVAEANQVVAYINQVLEPDVTAAVNAVINKRTQLINAGLRSTARDTFVSLRAATDNYGNVLLSKSPASVRPQGQAALDRVDADLARGQAAF